MDWLESDLVKGQRNTGFLNIILNCFSLFQGADSLLDVSSEADQQDLLVLLQAKVASLTLHNKELQDKLQVGIEIVTTDSSIGSDNWIFSG